MKLVTFSHLSTAPPLTARRGARYTCGWLYLSGDLALAPGTLKPLITGFSIKKRQPICTFGLRPFEIRNLMTVFPETADFMAARYARDLAWRWCDDEGGHGEVSQPVDDVHLPRNSIPFLPLQEHSDFFGL